MNTRLASLFVFLIAVCAPAKVAWANWDLVSSQPLASPQGTSFSHRKLSNDGTQVDLHVITFKPKTHRFVVMDNPAGSFTLATASRKRGVLAAVNGGYFHLDRTPLGLVIRQGVQLHPKETAKLLSGIVASTSEGVVVQRVGEYSGKGVTEALQAGPFLIDQGKPVVGLDNRRVAARTVVFTDNSGHAGLIVCKSASLAECAQILATPGVIGDSKIVRALNLDGGSSTGLWVAGTPEFYLSEGKEVRNYLGIIPRQ